MNIGTYTCLGAAIIFLVLALIFALLKEKAAILISGFNTMPKAKREYYDKKKMSLDMRNSLLLWAIIMALGTVCSHLVSGYAAIIAFGVWLIFFFREVHLDDEKAFGKYKIK